MNRYFCNTPLNMAGSKNTGNIGVTFVTLIKEIVGKGSTFAGCSARAAL
jgi:uncharacterized membrane protein YuzA (DUF378 family)